MAAPVEVTPSPWEGYKPSTVRSVAAPASLQPRKRFNFKGERIDKIDWHGQEIVPVNKDFLCEHPSVEARTEEECETIRTRNSIMITRKPRGTRVPKPLVTFEETPFPDWAANELRNKHFMKPTPIQVQAWPIALRGHDVVGIAETGSGKTMAYVLPMLVHVLSQPELRPGEGAVGLVLVPTRELCEQIGDVVNAFGKHTQIVCRSIFGGRSFDEQKEWAYQKMDIMVATPGRMVDMLDRRATNLRRATYFVLDEADDLLGNNFEQQVKAILHYARPDRQVLLFSATWPKGVEKFAEEVCVTEPIHVNVGAITIGACKNIAQHFRRVDNAAEKLEQLKSIIAHFRDQGTFREAKKMLVFCNRKETVRKVVDQLKAEEGLGIEVAGIAGDYMQADRDEVLRRFSSPDGGLPVVVCTQILGRGHDFSRVEFIVNYDMPERIVEYVHRIGRTGRAGQKGFSITFIADDDLWLAKELAQCLEESEQTVPDYVKAATSKKMHAHYKKLWRDKRYPEQANVPALSAGDKGGDAWHGRGQGRRHVFLERCNGEGAARPAVQ